MRIAGDLPAPTWRTATAFLRYRSATERELPGVPMSFFNSTVLDDLSRRLADAVPAPLRALGKDLEGNFKAVLQAQLGKLDLVNRQEFDVQAALLGRTYEQVAALEARLKELEAKLAAQ